MTRSWRRAWIIAASVAVVGFVGHAIGRRVVAGRLLGTLRTSLAARFGVETSADGVTLSMLDGTAVLEGFRIVDGPLTVFEAERIEVSGSLGDALAGRIDCSRLVVRRPVLRIVVEADGRTNLRRLLATPPKGPPGSAPELLVRLRDARFEDGRIEFTDAFADPERPLRAFAHHLGGTLTEGRSTGEVPPGSSSDFRVDGEIEQAGYPARLSVVGWGVPSEGPPTWNLLAAVTGFDLRGIPQYVGTTQIAAAGGDLVHLVVTLRSRDGVLGPGAAVAEVNGSGTVLPLRIGGTTSEPVFDLDSPLGALLRIPLSRAGRFGEVALDAGWSVVKGGAGAAAAVGEGVADAGVSLGTGLADAGGDLVSGDPLGALESAGGGVLGVATSLGEGLVEGVSRLFGGGAEAVHAFEGEDAAVRDRRFGALHAARRLVMLRAALASVVVGAAGGRRGRIEAEIGASPPGP